MTQKREKMKLVVCYYGPLILWMGVIFFLSSLEGSGGSGTLSLGQLVLRKGAHIIEYTVLTFLSYHVLLQVHGADIKKALVGAFGIALIYALSDEIHQVFVFGREGKLSDVGIDLIGIVFTVGVLAVTIGFIRRKRITHNIRA